MAGGSSRCTRTGWPRNVRLERLPRSGGCWCGPGRTKRVSVHGLRRTFNNLSRQVVGVIVTRAITGHVTEEMTEHYSHVDRAEKLRAADQVVALAGLRSASNDNSVAPLTRRPSAGDLSPFGGEVKSPPSGEIQVGDSTDRPCRPPSLATRPAPATAGVN